MAAGAAASRAWGHGAIQWTPSSVSAKVYCHVDRPAHRRVLVSTTLTDDEGRIKVTEVALESEATATMQQVKHMLCTKHMKHIAPERMRLIVYGAEVDDAQTLQEVSPTAADVRVPLNIIFLPLSLIEWFLRIQISMTDGTGVH